VETWSSTAHRHRATGIQANARTVTAADPLPDELWHALEVATRTDRPVH
jgi:hypothetical protein